jgi:hypothetical protein
VNIFGFMYESVSYAFACCLSVENKRYYYYYYYFLVTFTVCYDERKEPERETHGVQ